MRPVLVLLLLLACSAGSACSASTGQAWSPSAAVESDVLHRSPPPPADARPASIVRVVDGDTVLARLGGGGGGGALRVRVIGVDTPETVKPDTPVACFGKVASDYVKRLLAPGRTVLVAYEPGGQTDRYGRQLWDIWLPDGRLLAGLLVADGLGRAYPYQPQVRYATLLQSLQSQARSARRGLWGPPCHGHSFTTPDHAWPPT